MTYQIQYGCFFRLFSLFNHTISIAVDSAIKDSSKTIWIIQIFKDLNVQNKAKWKLHLIDFLSMGNKRCLMKCPREKRPRENCLPGKLTPGNMPPSKIAPGKNDPRKNVPQENCPTGNYPTKNCFTKFLLLLTLSYGVVPFKTFYSN